MKNIRTMPEMTDGFYLVLVKDEKVATTPLTKVEAHRIIKTIMGAEE